MFGRDQPVWNRDVDKLADPELLKILSRGSGAPPPVTFNTTLAAYKGWIVDQVNPYGNSKWVLPLGVYHRIRRGRGTQYCPQCLKTPPGPYYRRCWRLAFVVACPVHGVELLDECPNCHAPVCYHRRGMGDRNGLPDGSIELCFQCGTDLSRARATPIPRDEMQFHRYLAEGLSNGWVKAPDGRPVYAHLYLDVLHQLMKLMVSRHARGLGEIVSSKAGITMITPPAGHFEIEHLCVSDRRQLLLMSRWVLDRWPDRFLRICRDNKIWSAWLLRDMTSIPWWFASVVQHELYVRYNQVDPGYSKQWRRYRERRNRLNTKLATDAAHSASSR